MKLRSIFLAIIFVGSSSVISAQDYEASIGLRLGFNQTVTYKQFMGRDFPLEGLLGLYRNGFRATLLAERHNPETFGVDGLSWYYGAGGHVGTHRWVANFGNSGDQYTGSQLVVGIDGIIGIEYTAKEVPLNFSLDVKPTFELVGWNGYDTGAAFSIRYILR